ncbi:hypothetical protein LX64_03102 [Chitinophaga skermanii]|uniref:TIGR01777 family protein n=1 Tax=Chitinophaga skermanii TaxID=331697 RepID=A0A327QLK2_9BACT|nr:TIGR01777 family oxidoreductase [Chitinophaga skermanii]RAJ04223.1 hypothetical protein LX64_03102 [Chitinophaga skermanii]
MNTVLITGGTGLVGKELASFLLEKGYKVIIMSRHAMHADNEHLSYATWDVNRQQIDEDAIQQADYIVHLAGAGVADKRWTAARKKEIVDSRVESGNLLFNTLQKVPHKVKKVISASAIGFYGEDKGNRPFIESDPPVNDFLSNTCLAWEKSVQQIESLNIPTVLYRTGIVLSRDKGALVEFYKPLKFGFATILGSGEQMISWVHIQDIVRLYFNAIVNDQIKGIYNAVAPHPVSNRELVLSMAKAAKGNSYVTVHAPKFALKLALGEMSVEVLKSTTVSAQKIQQAGFQFSYPTIDEAMMQLFPKSSNT